MAAQLRSAPFVVLSLALSLVSMPASRVTAQQIPGSPIVTPDGQTLTALRNATGRVATFTIQSQGDVNETFGLQCSYQGTVGSCSVPSSISVGARQFVDVNVTFTVGGVGTGRVELSATGGGGEDSGWYTVNVQTVVSSGITTGTFHTCGLGGTGEAYCWGYNASGQLGIGTTGGSQLAPVAVTGGFSFSMLTAGDHHTCGLTGLGSAYCWGSNASGQLGDGTTASRSTPAVSAAGLSFLSLSAGFDYTCGVTTSYAAYCWGGNASGQRGDNTTGGSLTPVAVSGGHSFVSISAAQTNTCAVTLSNAAYCWGKNGSGNLGDGRGGYTGTEQSLIPVAVTGGLAFSRIGIHTGASSPCGVSTAGLPYCWGFDWNKWTTVHQLGIGLGAPDRCTVASTSDYANWCARAPVAVSGGLNATIVSSGAQFACALSTAATAHCWGAGELGRLGDGSWLNRDMPAAVAGGHLFSSLSLGNGHACAVTTSGATYCWRGNDFGVLGDGTQTHRGVPTLINDPGPTADYVSVRVFPKGVAPKTVQANGAVSDTLTVYNKGSISATFQLASVCSGTVTNCIAPPSVTIAAGGTGPAIVSYQTGRDGTTGKVMLRASYPSDAAVLDSGWVIVLASDAPPLQNPAIAGAGTERDLCLTIAAGSDAAYECGDLRTVHALPSVKTRNKDRTPTLLYNSQNSNPHPLVSADVTLTGTLPTSVTATLNINGATRITRTWSGGFWTPGATRRITLGFDGLHDPTGVYTYILQIDKTVAGAVVPIRTDTSKLVIVNRSLGHFGGGWSLAGLERLYHQVDGTKLFVGGDGSARIYSPVAGRTGVWAGPQIDRPDMIKQLGTNLYVQYLPHGVEVHFNAAGLHIATRNRLGYQTTFAYSAAGDTLKTITVPLGPSPTYSFLYRPTGDKKLYRIDAPGIGAPPRSTDFTHASGRITKIADPDGKFVEFGYNVPTYGHRLTWRRNRNGDTTFYKYDTAKRLSETSVDMGGTNPDLVTTYVAAEGKGIQGTAAIDTALVFTHVNGPRIDVTDVTKFWVDRFGAPRKIKNALNDSTIITRGDARWPALVTRVRAPNGAVQSSKYDDRGHMTSTTDSSTFRDELGGRSYATTRYDWDLAWDAVTRIELPEGEITEIAYDPANGNRLWQQDGRGLASRVNFTYHSTGASSGLLNTVKPPLSPATALSYDAVGNLSESITPLGSFVRYRKDAVGRDTLIVSPTVGTDTIIQRFVYDVMNQDTLTQSIGPGVSYLLANGGGSIGSQTTSIRKFYDAEGRADSIMRRAEGAHDNAIGWITTSWRYDAAGRKIKEIAPTPNNDTTVAESWVYDPAGNVTAWSTRRKPSINQNVTMAYDALNRLTTRIVPPVSYADTTIDTGSGQIITFPRYSVGQGITLAGETATFTYDASGNVLTADNADAKVSRSYFLNGTVSSDTMRIRDYDAASADFSKHVYGHQFRYDLNGRRTLMRHPRTLAPIVQGAVVRDSVLYSYGNPLGLLASVTDVMGYRFNYSYDVQGRLAKLAFPAGVEDLHFYNDDGLLLNRIERGINLMAHTARPSSTTLHLNTTVAGGLSGRRTQTIQRFRFPGMSI